MPGTPVDVRKQLARAGLSSYVSAQVLDLGRQTLQQLPIPVVPSDKHLIFNFNVDAFRNIFY